MNTLFNAFLIKNLYLIGVLALILFARVLLSRFPKKYSYYLWVVFGIKALTDIGLSVKVNLPFVTKQLSASEIVGKTADFASDTAGTVTKTLSSGAPLITPITVSFVIWLAGTVALLTLGVVRYFLTKKKISVSFPAGEGIHTCDYIDSPMTFGLFKPVIYVPGTSDPKSLRFVLAHERCHIRRGDIYYKLLAYLILSVFWFNPFIWIAYKLFNLDMELSCDEAAVDMLGNGSQKEYAVALLSFSAPGSSLLLAQTDFADTDAKRRVKNIMNKKNLGLCSIFAGSILAVLIISLCFLKPEPVFGKSLSAVSTSDGIIEAPAVNELHTTEPAESSDTKSADLIPSEPVESSPIDTNAENEVSWLWPLDFTVITSDFGVRKTEGAESVHTGVDIAAPAGSNVYAALSGTVTTAERDFENGNILVIAVNDQISYRYTHLDSYSVEVGQTVERGQTIAKVGTTGLSTGPHLHFEILVNGQPVDPFGDYYERPQPSSDIEP
ncbi:MAG: peptidoglycan DD-metalloendopeptidase family protein [Lachnospiraceae bacterium]|nr:peptidoglycan DD-metalloendopeptidase family protein [Lachnospiraceae bacterium]